MTESDYAQTFAAERAAFLAERACERLVIVDVEMVRASALSGPDAWWARVAGEIGAEA